jgi:hypothetical protein
MVCPERHCDRTFDVTASGRLVFSFLSTVTASRKGVLSDLNGALNAAKQSPVL